MAAVCPGSPMARISTQKRMVGLSRRRLCYFKCHPTYVHRSTGLDYLHNPDPRRGGKTDSRGMIFTSRGLANLGCLFLVASTLLMLLCVPSSYSYFPTTGLTALYISHLCLPVSATPSSPTFSHPTKRRREASISVARTVLVRSLR